MTHSDDPRPSPATENQETCWLCRRLHRSLGLRKASRNWETMEGQVHTC